MLTTVITHATGDVFPASDWNTYLRDNLNYLIAAGANLASAATITPTNECHIVTGTTQIDNLTPASPVNGQPLRLLFQGALTIRNNGGGTGNIRTRSGTDRSVAANEIIEFTYDSSGSVWREGGPGPAGVVLLFDSALAGVSFPTAGITFSSIPQGYRNLRVVSLLRCSAAGTNDNGLFRVNGDTGSNYYYAGVADSGGTLGTVNGEAGNGYLNFAAIAGNGLGNSSYSLCETVIFAYTDTTSGLYKHMNSRGGYVGTASGSTNAYAYINGQWRTTNTAITSLTVGASVSNLVTPSRVLVYGEM
jgi:hypothetical protein